MGKKFFSKYKKVCAVFLTVVFIVNPVFPGVLTLATKAEETLPASYTTEQEGEVGDQEVIVEEPTIEQPQVIEDVIVEEPSETTSEVVVSEETTPDFEEMPSWILSDNVGTYKTTKPVELRQYFHPENGNLSVTFTQLPGVEAWLTMQIVNLSDEEVATSGSVSRQGYSLNLVDANGNNIADGTFFYNLTLPNPGVSDIKVEYAESRADIASATDVGIVENNGGFISIYALNHFTLFIITDDAATYTNIAGVWIDWPTQGYIPGVHFPTDVNPGATATWTFSTITSGVHGVYISWSTHSNRTTSAPYVLNYNGVTSPYSFTINQELLADQVTVGGAGEWSGWYYVGAFDLNTSSNLVLTGVDNTSGTDYVIADEVGLLDVVVPEITSPANGSTFSTIGSPIIDWTGVDGTSTTYEYEVFSDAAYLNSIYLQTGLPNSQITVGVTTPNTYYLRVRAHDSAGIYTEWSNSASDPFMLIVDNTAAAPVIAFTDPINNVNQTLATVTGTAEAGATISCSIADSAIVPVVVTTSGTADSSGNVNITPVDVSTLLDGTLTITCYQTDLAGNVSPDAIITATKNTVAPTIAINSVPVTTFDTTPGLSGTYTGTVTTISVVVNGNTYAATNNGDGTWTLADNTISPALAVGTYEVVATATDNIGNVGTDSTSNELIIALIGAPTPISPSDGATVPSNSPFSQTWTSVTGAALYRYESCNVDPGDAGNPCTSIRFTQTFPGTTTIKNVGAGLPDGHLWWRLRSQDAYGNLGNWGESYELYIDATAPVITVPADITTGATGPSGAVVSFVATAIDNYDPAPVIACIPPSGSTFPLGTTSVICTATDAAGNSASDTFDITVVDTTPPSVPTGLRIVLPDTTVLSCGSYTNSYTIIADWDDSTDLNGISRYQYNVFAPGLASWSTYVVPSQHTGVFNLGEGLHGFRARAEDIYGNWSDWSDYCEITYDITAPVMSGLTNITAEATSAAGAEVTFAPTATDNFDISPDIVCTPTSGSTFSIGSTPVTCTATDDAGNFASGTFNVIVVDTTAPVVSVPSDMTVQTVSPSGIAVTFSATAEDIVDGTLVPTCSPASGSTFSLGTTLVTCTAVDAAGNSGSATFNVIVQDTIAPVITVDTLLTRNRRPPLTGTVDDTNATITVTVNGNTYTATNDGDGTWSLAANVITSLADGTYNVVATATDPVGNSSSDSTTNELTIDRTAPVLSWAYPSNLAVLSGTVTLQANATDAIAGVDFVRFRFAPIVGGFTVIGGDDTTSPYEVNWDTTTVSDGVYRLRLTSNDTLGNTVTLSDIFVSIDNTAPIVFFTNNVSAAPVTSDTITFIMIDANPDITSFQYAFTSDPAICNDTLSFTSGWSFVVNDMSHNGQWVCARASDTLGHTGYRVSANPLNIDLTAPIITANTTLPSSVASANGTLTYTIEASDVGRGGSRIASLTVDPSYGTITPVNALNSPTEQFTWTWNTTTVADGTYNLRFCASDRLGNTGDGSDTALPTGSSDAECYAVTIEVNNLGSIDGLKFLDVNGNGVFDPEEQDVVDDVNRLNGWNIYLFNSNWGLIDQIETGYDGMEKGDYEFTDLSSGTYYVCEEDRYESSYWRQTLPDAYTTYNDYVSGTSNGSAENVANYCYSVTLNPGVEISNVDFGNLQYGRIIVDKDVIDANGGDIYDSTEFRIALSQNESPIEIETPYISDAEESPLIATLYVTPGEYNVSEWEDEMFMYYYESLGCSLNEDMETFTYDVSGGETIYVTCVNQVQPGYLVVYKDVIDSNGNDVYDNTSFEVNLTQNGSPVEGLESQNISDAEVSPATATFTVPAGSYDVDELLTSDQVYNFSELGCTYWYPKDDDVTYLPTFMLAAISKADDTSFYVEPGSYTYLVCTNQQVTHGGTNPTNYIPIIELLPASLTINVGQTATLTANPSSGDLPYGPFVWGGECASASGNTSTLSGLAIGTYTCTVRITDSNGDTSNTATATINVVEEGQPSDTIDQNNPNNLIPRAYIAATPGTTVYEPTTITLNGIVIGGDLPIVSYQWGGNCSGTGTSTTVPNVAGTYVCTLQVQDNNGDYSTNPEASITLVVLPTQVLGQSTEEKKEEPKETEEEKEGEVLGEADLCEKTRKLGGYIFEDEKKDENGVKDVTVEVYYYDIKGDRKLLVKDVTSETGYWEVEVCPGQYEIEIVESTIDDKLKLNSDQLIKRVLGDNADINDADFELTEPEGGFNWLLLLIPAIILLLLALLLLAKKRRDEENK